jgi:2-polyprenyl-3-methyl-5-hydroxy-6-metoxy-1,4-benzoquinol methylase
MVGDAPESFREARERADYTYTHARPNPSHLYLWPIIQKVIASTAFHDRRAIDLGCGSGATAQMLFELGFNVVGIDASESGIAQAGKNYPDASFFEGNVYDDLVGKHGKFPLAVSLEVIEHLYHPGELCKTLYSLLSEGGIGILSTPYHGYFKNLSIAFSGRYDRHHNPLRDGGHIKFFSTKTLGTLLRNAGFEDVSFVRAGRIPPLAKSVVAIVRR